MSADAGMSVDVAEEPWTAIAEHARIPISFRVDRVLEVEDLKPTGGVRLTEREVNSPYEKDYDALEGGSPLHLAETFDVARWGLLAARSGGRRVGGAIVAFDTPGVAMLEGRRDLAVVWDLRVLPDVRRHGVGRALWEAAEAWAASRGCTQLKVETQNVNLPACRFYAARGCVLAGVQRLAYPHLPEEVQLLWIKTLRPAEPGR